MSGADRKDPTPGDSVDLIIQVSRDHDVGLVAESLRRAGVQVERELKRAYVVGGKIPRALINNIAKIPGVKMVREADTFQLPPFESDMPQ